MKKLLFVLLSILLISTTPMDSVVVDTAMINRFNADTTSTFIQWNYGFYKVEYKVLPKDSVYQEFYRYKYIQDSSTVYIKY